MQYFREYITEAPVQSQDFKDRLEKLNKIIKEQIESFDPKMSPDAAKGKKVVDKMQDGTYELISHMTSVAEIEKYAEEASKLSPNDMSLNMNDEDDEKFYEENMDTWDLVSDNAEYISLFNHHAMTNKEYGRIQKVLKGTLKRI
jgi:hypothetical protein